MSLLIDQQSAVSEGKHVLDQNINSCVSSQKVKHWVQTSSNDDEEPNVTRARRPNHIKRPAHRTQTTDTIPDAYLLKLLDKQSTETNPLVT